MSQKCDVCGKGPHRGGSIVQRGKAKREGGIGRKTTGHTKRTFAANIQRVKARVDGAVKHIKICAQCIRANKVTKVA
jgi:large subunit ribosomal protein L28